MKSTLIYILITLACYTMSCQTSSSDTMILQTLLQNKHRQKNTLIIQDNTSSMLKSLQEITEYKTQCRPLYSKCYEIRQLADSLSEYIDHLKIDLINSSGGYSNSDAPLPMMLTKIPKNAQATEIVQQMLLTDKQQVAPTQIITRKIQFFYQFCINLLNDSWENGGIKGTIFADITKKEASIQSIKKVLNSPFLYKVRTIPDQLDQQLQGKSLAAALSLLSLIQNDIYLQAHHITNFFCAQISYMHHYTFLPGCISAAKQSVRLGETYHAKILCGIPTNVDIKSARINGKHTTIDNNKVLYSTPVTHVGGHTYQVNLTFSNPYTNTIDSLEKSFYFNANH